MAFTLSHLCTTYNYAKYLPEHLAAVRRQTKRPDRVVVSDDRSPKDTPEQVAAACAGYPEAEVVIQPVNLGSARHVHNLCNAVETDAYITMSADDNVADPTFYEEACAILENDPGVVAVFGQFQHMDEHGRPISGALPALDTLEPTTRFSGPEMRRLMAFENIVPSVCVVVRTRRSAGIPAYPIFNEYCTDWLHFYLLSLSGAFVRINRIICHYRVQAAGLYMQHLSSPLARQRKDEGYQALLDWPGLTDQERRLLQISRARDWFQLATIKDKPAALLRYWNLPGAWLGAAEFSTAAAAHRLVQANRHLRKLAKDPFLGPG